MNVIFSVATYKK